MTDEEHADRVREALAKASDIINEAVEAGLDVEVDHISIDQMGKRPGRRLLIAHIQRVQKL